jgi:hypothetical protein
MFEKQRSSSEVKYLPPLCHLVSYAATIAFPFFSLTDALGTMSSQEFYEFLSSYKFSLAMENAVCDDYVTEKFWRPFIAGSVPIVFGSSKAKVCIDMCNCACLEQKKKFYFLFDLLKVLML